MLRVSIHAGPLTSISRFNRLDWLDIGYSKLDAMADYKIVLFKIGEDALPPVHLRNYPRWSASLWDLAARAMLRALYGSAENANSAQLPEEVPPAINVKKKRAFAETMSAVIQHIPNAGLQARHLASMQIDEDRSSRCSYRARIEEDMQKTRLTESFTFAPSFLRPAELVLRATLFSMTGSTDKVPPRPILAFPKDVLIEGKRYIAVHKIREPARTGLLRWLYHHNQLPVLHAGAPEGLTPWSHFEMFLKKAV